MPSPREHALAELLRMLGLTNAPALFERALTHPSYANEHRENQNVQDNQRLEFLGDAVLDLCVSEILLERLPSADEGVLSRAYGALVNADALADWARARGVGPALLVGKGAAVSGVPERTNVLADAVEAIIAAVYLDGGLEQARRIAELIVEEGLSRSGELARRDSKTELQEWMQSRGCGAPAYRVMLVEGPAHDRRFVVGVEIDGAIVAQGRGRSKKLAEQAAAALALEHVVNAPLPLSPAGESIEPPLSPAGDSIEPMLPQEPAIDKPQSSS
jgi:ribonuclease-3